MATKKYRAAQPSTKTANDVVAVTASDGSVRQALGGKTGRFLVLFKEGRNEDGVKELRRFTAVKQVASSEDYVASAIDLSDTKDMDATVYEKLGVAVATIDPKSMAALSSASGAASDSAILWIEPEYYTFAIGGAGVGGDPSSSPLDYFRGYKDAVDHLYEKLAQRASPTKAPSVKSTPPSRPALPPKLLSAAAAFADDNTSTWGVQATQALDSPYSGKGIRIAILDTGLDLQHPDFQGRVADSQSFVLNEAVQDRFGHGTHCAGIACGPQSPSDGGPRYGVAYDADLYIGKIMNNAGSGNDSQTLAGIEWAITNGCDIVSMSLGNTYRLDPQASLTQSPFFEQIGTRALKAGTLLIAAAGNDSERSQSRAAPVSRPANASTIMAVAAVDQNGNVADFSNRTNPNLPQGGHIDISGPGWAVSSSWPGGGRKVESGTSMATPFVAGIAALIAEAEGVRGTALWQRLFDYAQPLTGDPDDVGVGMVTAPVPAGN